MAGKDYPQFRQVLYPGCGAAAALVSPGVIIYLNNPDHFSLSPLNAAILFLAAAVVIAICCAVPLLLSRKSSAVYDWIHAGILALAVASAAQTHFFCHFFPAVLSSQNSVSEMILPGLFHGVLLLVPFAVMFYFRKQIRKWSGKITAVIVLSQLVMAAGPMFSGKPSHDYDFKNYVYSDEEKFMFASRTNVIVIAVDCMGERICKEVLRKYPELGESLKDFTCFDRMVSPLPRTIYALPAMLTGINFPRTFGNQPAEADHAEYVSRVFRSEGSLFMQCRKQGWRAEGYPFFLQTFSFSPDVISNSLKVNYRAQKQSAVKILDTALGIQVPFFLLGVLREFYYIATDPFVTPTQVEHKPDELWDPAFYRRLDHEFRIGNYPCGFKFYHLLGAHEPIRTDENLQPVRETLKYRQLRGSLKIVELLLAKLKRSGLYEQSAIVIVGDHSESYTPEVAALIKRPGDHRDKLMFNSIPCQVSDLAGTVSRMAGLNPAAPSLFDLTPRPGSLDSARDDLFSVLDFPAWKPFNAFVPSDSGAELYQIPFILENGHLLIDLGNERLTRLRKISLFAENLSAGQRFGSKLSITGKPAYARIAVSGFADGIYLMTAVSVSDLENGGEGEVREDIQRLPKFLCIRNGKSFLADYPDNLPAVTMKVGQTLEFQPMLLYPQLVLPPEFRAEERFLHLEFGRTFGVRIPTAKQPLALEITLRLRIPCEGRITAFINGSSVRKFLDGTNSDTVLTLPLSDNKEQLPVIHFTFQPLLRNRAERTADSVIISKIRLIPLQ